jgi:hypothetical protein
LKRQSRLSSYAAFSAGVAALLGAIAFAMASGSN